MVAFLAWLAIGGIMALFIFLTVHNAIVEYKKQVERLRSLQRANSSAGLKIMKPGLGWVPANGAYRR